MFPQNGINPRQHEYLEFPFDCNMVCGGESVRDYCGVCYDPNISGAPNPMDDPLSL